MLHRLLPNHMLMSLAWSEGLVQTWRHRCPPHAGSSWQQAEHHDSCMGQAVAGFQEGNAHAHMHVSRGTGMCHLVHRSVVEVYAGRTEAASPPFQQPIQAVLHGWQNVNVLNTLA